MMLLSGADKHWQRELLGHVGAHRPGWTLERWFYTDSTLYAAELECIFRPAWMFAGYTCQIPRPGDYFTYEMDTDSLVIIRGDDGQIRALHNTCRHRGSLICTQRSGHVGKMVCPYHQWTYARDGRLLGCGGMTDDLDKTTLGLAPAPLETVGGLIFVSFGDHPPPFAPARQTMGPELTPHGFERAKVACSIDYEIAANWKLVWENNRECLHCPVGHPQYVPANYDVASPDDARIQAEIEARSAECEARWRPLGLGARRQAGLVFFPDGVWYRASRTPLAPGFVTESVDGRQVAPLMGDFTEVDMGTLRLSTLPNFWNHASSDHAVSTRLTPAGPQRTLAQVTWLVREDAVEGTDYELEKLLPFWQLTSEQDWVLCDANQRGVNSSHYRPGPYSAKKEYNVARFVDWYLNAVQTGSDVERPRVV